MCSGIQTRDDDGAGEVAAEQGPVQPGTDHRHAQRDRRESRAQACSREQVVGQRVPEVALEHCQDQQQRPDDPVRLAWPAERAGEEYPGQVHHDRRGEQQRGPVMDLADEQAAAHFERDVERRSVGLRHLDAAQRLVDAVVGDLGHRRVEEEAQIHAGEEQDDEAVQRDLAKQERPVGGEHLVELTAHRGRRVVAGIDRLTLFGGDICQFRTHLSAPANMRRRPGKSGQSLLRQLPAHARPRHPKPLRIRDAPSSG